MNNIDKIELNAKFQELRAARRAFEAKISGLRGKRGKILKRSMRQYNEFVSYSEEGRALTELLAELTESGCST